MLRHFVKRIRKYDKDTVMAFVEIKVYDKVQKKNIWIGLRKS